MFWYYYVLHNFWAEWLFEIEMTIWHLVKSPSTEKPSWGEEIELNISKPITFSSGSLCISFPEVGALWGRRVGLFRSQGLSNHGHKEALFIRFHATKKHGKIYSLWSTEDWIRLDRTNEAQINFVSSYFDCRQKAPYCRKLLCSNIDGNFQWNFFPWSWRLMWHNGRAI